MPSDFCGKVLGGLNAQRRTRRTIAHQPYAVARLGCIDDVAIDAFTKRIVRVFGAFILLLTFGTIVGLDKANNVAAIGVLHVMQHHRLVVVRHTVKENG